jgi:hypothetical protein
MVFEGQHVELGGTVAVDYLFAREALARLAFVQPESFVAELVYYDIPLLARRDVAFGALEVERIV